MQLSRMGAWPGGTVADLSADGATVLAATFAGIHRSTDGGKSWKPVDADLPDWFIQAVALAPVSADADREKRRPFALAASHMGWLYRSTDGGETWEIASRWGDLGVVTGLFPSPSFAVDGIVFACTEEDGILKSTDRGQTWKRASFGLLNLSATALVFSPDFARDEIAFAGTAGGGLFRSRNAGRAWRESGEGLPDSAVQCLAISPSFVEDGVLYAGTEEAGLYRSLDKGRTWSPIGESLSEACINGLYLPPSWAAGGRLIAATDQGILVSVDAGNTWQSARGGPSYPFTVIRTDSCLLAGAYDKGVYGSPDGMTWQTRNNGLAAHLPPVACFSEAFESDRTLLMNSMEGSVVRTRDGGRTWEPVPAGREALSASLIASAGEGAAMVLLAASEEGLAWSQDSGRTWEPLDGPNTGGDPLSVVALSDSSLCGGDATTLLGTTGGQVYLAEDAGQSWARYAHYEGERVVALAVCAESVGAPEGELERTICAVTARPQPEGTWRLALRVGRPSAAAQIYQASEPSAVMQRINKGQWLCAMGAHIVRLEGAAVVAESRLDDDAPVSSLAGVPGLLLAGTRSGLYRSVDGACSWEKVTAEIPVVGLHLASPAVAYAVSMGGQVWEVALL